MWAERFTTASGRLQFDRPSGPAPARLLGLNRSGLQHKSSLGLAGLAEPEQEFRAWREDWGARILRLPLALDLLLEQARYRSDLARAVEAARAARLYLILELHGLTGDLSRALPPDEAAAAWRFLAAQYGQDAHVLFDLWNEPHDVAWCEWAAHAQGLIDVVRANGGELSLVIVSGVDWGYDLSALRDPSLRLDGRGGPLAYGAHVYPFKSGHLLRRASCERAFGRAARELPVIVTEFGVLPARSAAGRLLTRLWLRGLLRYLDARELSALAWSAGDHPQLALGPDGRAVRLPDNPPDPLQPTPQFGLPVRQWLRARASRRSGDNRGDGAPFEEER